MPFLEQSRGITVKGGNFHDASVNVTNYTPKNGEFVLSTNADPAEGDIQGRVSNYSLSRPSHKPYIIRVLAILSNVTRAHEKNTFGIYLVGERVNGRLGEHALYGCAGQQV